MSEALTSATEQRLIGPGRLVLIVGPSGAGKDTLIALVREQCANDAGIVFARRTVTREATAAEDNTHIEVAAFHVAAARGDFALHWQAHGHCYGLPRGIDDDIRRDCTVVANVSRTVIAAARQTYADVLVVAITAPPEVLTQRLSQRGRSSDGVLGDRLTRVVDNSAAVPDQTINNVDDATVHASELLAIIRAGKHP